MEIVIFAIYIYICLHIKLGFHASIPPFILTYIPLYISPLISIIDFKINFRKFPFVSKIWAHNLPDEPEALKKKQSRKVPWLVVCMYVDIGAPKASKNTLLKKLKIPLTTTLNHFRVFVSWSFCHPKWFGHHLSARDGPTSALIPTKKKKGRIFHTHWMHEKSSTFDAWEIRKHSLKMVKKRLWHQFIPDVDHAISSD